MLEATCLKCLKTFVPADEGDIIHEWDEELSKECGGQGVILGEWIPTPRVPTQRDRGKM